MKKRIITGRLALLALSMFTLVFSLSACGGNSADDTGSTPLTILSIEGGKVLVMKPGDAEWTEGTEGMALGVDYKIKTQSGGHAVITFFEGSTIELDSGTEITLTALDLDGTASQIGIEQKIGRTVSRVQALMDPESSYEIETASAIAAVRGTEFYVSVTSSGTTTVGSTEGTVTVEAQGVSVELTEGNRTTVSPGEPPGEPEPDIVRERK